MGAVSPREAVALKNSLLPTEVLAVWNAMIAKKFDGTNTVTILQCDIIKALMPLTPRRDSRQHILDEHWLDVEQIYRAAGWHVEYDKPSYCETYEASFAFTPK